MLWLQGVWEGAEGGSLGTPNKQEICSGGGGGAWHEAMVLGFFAFGGAYWPLAHSDPLGPLVFWLRQRSPWMICPVRLSQRRAVARAIDQVQPSFGGGGGGLFRSPGWGFRKWAPKSKSRICLLLPYADGWKNFFAKRFYPTCACSK